MKDKLFNFFWNIEDGPILYKENKTFIYGVTLSPKYPPIIMGVWLILDKVRDLCKSLISHE